MIHSNQTLHGQISFPNAFRNLAALLLTEPITKVIFIKVESGFTFIEVLHRVLALRAPADFFFFWLLFPLTGICLIYLRKWTYILFCLLQIVSLVFHLSYRSYSWPYVAKDLPLFSLLLIGMNLFLFLFIADRDHRMLYFYERLRWWQVPGRFGVKKEAKISFEDQLLTVTLMDISLTGVLIKIPSGSTPTDLNNLILNYVDEDFNITIPCRVVRELNEDTSSRLLGCEFEGISFTTKSRLAKYLRMIEKERRYFYKR